MRLLSALFVAGLAFGQQTVGDVKTTGNCSPVAAGNSNVFTITCGIGQSQGKRLLDIANKILSGQATLDDIKSDVQALRDDVAGLSNAPGVSVGNVNVQPGAIMSIGQTGGFTGQVIVPKKPARRIPADIQAKMVEELAKTPGEVSISAFAGDTEAYQLAKDIFDVFDRAQWTFKERKGISSFLMSGQPYTGIKVSLVVVGKPGDQYQLEGWRWGGIKVLRTVAEYLKYEFKDDAVSGDKESELTINVAPQ